MFKKYYMVYYADLFDTLLGMPYLSKEEISEYLYTNKRENGNKCEIVEILKCPRGLVSDFVDKGYKVYDF